MIKISLAEITIVFVLILGSGMLIPQISAQDNEPVNISNTGDESGRVQIIVDDKDVYAVWTDDFSETSDVFFAKSRDGGKTFDRAINLSQNDGPSAFPRLAISESNVYIIWYDYTPGQSDIFFAKSNDKGESFDVTNISDTPMPSYNPWIAASSNFVYIVFNDGGITATMELPSGKTQLVDFNTGDEELILLRSDDYGETFEFINLSNTPGVTSWNARIKVLGSNVFVDWNERINYKGDIFFTKSTDNGKTFTEPTNLSNNPLDSVDSIIAVDQNNLYIIWNDSKENSTDIFFVKSTDNGDTFGSPINLSHSTSSSIFTRDYAIAVSGNNIFVVWYDASNQENFIFFTRSTDGGLTFSNPINLSPDNSISKYPQVVSNDNNVYVIWHDYSQGNGDIFLIESVDYGATFDGIKNLSNNEHESNIFILGPQIALSNNQVYAVWQDKTDSNTDLYMTSFAQSEGKAGEPFLLSTSNDAVNVEVSIENQLEIDEPTNFTIRFIESSSGILLEEVNYSIEVLDAAGKKIASIQGLFAQNGTDSQSITFDETGPITFLIDIVGTGADRPYDTNYSGKTSVIFTVVPEFPFGVIMSLGVVIGLVIIITFFKSQLFIQKTF